MISVGLEHMFGLDGTPRSCAIERHGVFLPSVANGVDDSPCLEYLVVPREEGGVSKNGISEKTFVSFGGVGAEFAGITEFHIDGLNGAASGAFRIEAEMNALVRLEADMHRIAAEEIPEFRTEESGGWTTKHDDNFRGASGEGFSGSKIEGNTRPTPVIDLNFEGGVGFSRGVWIHTIRLAISLVLRPNCAGTDGFHFWGGDGAENFNFFVVDRLGG